MSASPARDVATRVLFRVAEQGAYAMPTLDAELKRASPRRRDAALATEIVYGALRVLPALDARLARYLDKPLSALDGYVRAAFRAAVYQLVHLARVPPHAVVNDAVVLVARERSAALKPLVNAVLRRVARERPLAPEPPTEVVTPDWLTRVLRESLGEARADLFLRARVLPPPVDLRVQSERRDRTEVAREIERVRPDATVRIGTLSPHAVRVQRAGDPRLLPGYEDGWFSVQEEGAQTVGLVVDVQRGERVLDACAGHGGKTMQLATATGPDGVVAAIDLYENKLQHIADEQARLAVSTRVETHTLDLSVGTGGLEPSFDRVLVDAPCTGLGTLHRRPELLLRVGAEDLARMADLQVAILSNAAKLVRPGGLLVYAVCSPMRDEGAAVRDRFEALSPGFERATEPWAIDMRSDEDGFLRIGPWSALSAEGTPRDPWGTDIYQAFRWRLCSPI